MATGEARERWLESQDPDVGLMLRVREDVPGAFEALVRRYQRRLIGVLAHLVGDAGEAEDLAQEVFLRVYRSRASYRPRARFSTWLFTIANNVARNHLRGRRRHPAVPLEGGGSGSFGSSPAADRLAGPVGTASSQLRKVELGEVVRASLASLGEDQRLAVLLSKFEEMSYAEIAEVMGRSEAAVKSLLARARATLRDQLEPYLLAGRPSP